MTLRTVKILDAAARPAWVLNWRGFEAAVRGPMMTDEQRDKLIADLRCVFLVAVDAKNGSYLTVEQVCA